MKKRHLRYVEAYNNLLKKLFFAVLIAGILSLMFYTPLGAIVMCMFGMVYSFIGIISILGSGDSETEDVATLATLRTGIILGPALVILGDYLGSFYHV